MSACYKELHEEGEVEILTCNEHNYALLQQYFYKEFM